MRKVVINKLMVKAFKPMIIKVWSITTENLIISWELEIFQVLSKKNPQNYSGTNTNKSLKLMQLYLVMVQWDGF